MNTPFDFLRKRAERILTQPGLRSAMQWQGATIYGTRTTLRMQDAATLSGMDCQYVFSLLVPASQLGRVAGLPHPRRDRVTVDGQSYLVLATETDVGQNVRFHLGDDYA